MIDTENENKNQRKYWIIAGVVLLVMIMVIVVGGVIFSQKNDTPALTPVPIEIPVTTFDTPLTLQSFEMRLNNLQLFPSVLMLDGTTLSSLSAETNELFLVVDLRITNSDRNLPFFCIEGSMFQLSGAEQIFDLVGVGSLITDTGAVLMVETANHDVTAARVGFNTSGYAFVRYAGTDTRPGISSKSEIIVARPDNQWFVSPIAPNAETSIALLFATTTTTNLFLHVNDMQVLLTQPQINVQPAQLPEFVLELIAEEYQQLSIVNGECEI